MHYREILRHMEDTGMVVQFASILSRQVSAPPMAEDHDHILGEVDGTASRPLQPISLEVERRVERLESMLRRVLRERHAPPNDS